ncbi:leucocin A/sakacin P family class II bacteriocin [Clostridium beijerinckii]|uniref:leucocin A/sakacin P family class II bacteriocin n=1 Tax=Clostridium beijerinckii TaxID=1520 RepID=UPI00047CB6F2|nr:leucocin A/sakacin P family class II bacteriocin [Clostridium beijerinckii]
MEKFTELTDKEMEMVSGGTYYGNGVSCDDKKCTVDWGKAWSCGADRWGGEVASGGKAPVGNC